MGKFIDMTGWVMKEHGVPDSRLTVIKRMENATNKHAQWLCRCSCPEHNEIITTGDHLRRGDTLSCGCMCRERTAESNSAKKKQYNKYDINGNVVTGYTSNNNEKFYVDLKNFDKIKNIYWCDYYDGSGIHMIAGWDQETQQTVVMHRYLGFDNYDHIDHNELNNLESNLRLCTPSQNCMNRVIRSDNTTNFIGVYRHKKNNKWYAKISDAPGSTIQVYYGDSKQDAIIARLKAEVKYYGDFAPQRHLFDEYGITTQNDCEGEE